MKGLPHCICVYCVCFEYHVYYVARQQLNQHLRMYTKLSCSEQAM
jgi:hypothetical protein